MSKQYLDKDGLLYFWQKIKNVFVSDVSYDSTNKKIQKTKAGTTSDVVTLSTVATSGSYTDLSNKPTIPTLKNVFGNVKVGSTTIAADTTQDTLELVAGDNVTLTPDATNDKVTIAATDTVYMAETTGSGNAVTSVSISSNVITATKDTTFLTSHQTIKQDGVTGATVNRYGSCSTAAATAAKTVSITTGTFSLEAGAKVTVKFANANTASTPTLNVASKGAKNIFHKGAQITTGDNKALLAGVCDFVYDGTQWHLIGNYIDTDTWTANTASKAGYVASGSGQASKVWKTDASGNPAWRDESLQNIFSSVTLGDVQFIAGSPTDSFRIDAGGGIDGTVDTVDNSLTLSVNNSHISTIIENQKGVASGICPLNASSKIDSTYLPSYVDDVIEAYARSGQTALGSTWLATGSASGTVITPETGKIYVLMADSGDYAANTQFRWSGSAYVKLADGGVSSITNAEIDTIVAA